MRNVYIFLANIQIPILIIGIPTNPMVITVQMTTDQIQRWLRRHYSQGNQPLQLAARSLSVRVAKPAASMAAIAPRNTKARPTLAVASVNSNIYEPNINKKIPTPEQIATRRTNPRVPFCRRKKSGK